MSRCAILALAALAFCVTTAPRLRAQPAAATTTVQLEEHQRVITAVLADCDGDGLGDLVVAVLDWGRNRNRFLRIHHRKKGAASFSGTPDREVRLTPDVTAFATADVASGGGDEIVFFNATGAYLMPAGTRREARPRKLCDLSFLWQHLKYRYLICWNAGIRDLDGDGLVDFVIPEPGAVRLVFQDRSSEGVARFDRQQCLEIPVDAADLRALTAGGLMVKGVRRVSRLEQRLHLSGVAGERGNSGTLLEVAESVPAPQLEDWDGDGDLDLALRTVEKLLIWIQEPGGSFGAGPRYSYPMPVVADQARRLDVSYSADLRDLNGDRRADCVFLAGNQRSDESRSQILVYLQGFQGRGPRGTTPVAPLFGPRGIPAQLLPLAGIAALPRLDDVNLDGLPDLAVASFRPDAIDMMRSKASGSLDIGYHLFLNRRNGFSSRADISMPITLRAETLDEAQGFVQIRFFADLDRNGARDLLLQDHPQRVRIFSVRRTRGGVQLAGDPMWSLTFESEGEVRFPWGARPGEFLVLMDRQVLHVEFPR